MPVEKIAEQVIMEMFGISWSEASPSEKEEVILIVKKILSLAEIE